MPARFQTSFWRRVRLCVRWCRIAVLLLVLVAVCGLIYLNRIGLPEFVKQRLLEELRAQGIHLQYERMRLDNYGGIVAEKVHFGETNTSGSPRLFAERVGLQLKAPDLKKFRFVVNSVAIKEARFEWSLVQSNQPPELFVLEKINAELGLLPGHRWELYQMEASGLGATIRLTGSLDNAAALRGRQADRTQGTWQETLREVVAISRQLHFERPPEIKAFLLADALEPHQTRARLVVQAQEARTPWGDADDFLLTVQTEPPAQPDERLSAQVDLQLFNVQTRWGRARKLELHTQTSPGQKLDRLPGAGLDITAFEPDTPWGKADHLMLRLSTPELTTNALPGTQATLTLESPQTEWGRAKRAVVRSAIATVPPEQLPATNAAWGGWAKLAPYSLWWQIDAEAVDSPKLQMESFTSTGRWLAPELKVENFQGRLYGGKLEASAELDVMSREVQSSATINFDVKQLTGLLSSNALRWLNQYGWETPPHVRAQAGLRMPEWTNSKPDWNSQVFPTLWLQGALTNQAGSFRQVKFTSAQSTFSLSNGVWHLPDLRVTRPEGPSEISYTSDTRTQDYVFKLRGGIDPHALRSLLKEKQQKGMELLQFDRPVQFDGQVQGNWKDHTRLQFHGRLNTEDISFRGERLTHLDGELQYTDQLFSFREVHARRDQQTAYVPAGSFDLQNMAFSLSNAVTQMDPFIVTRMIGPRTTASLEPYQFLKPPRVIVNGVIPVNDLAGIDLWFEVDGGQFQCWKFSAAKAQARLHWAGDWLSVTNVAAAGFFGGELLGHALFDFSAAQGTDFSFVAAVSHCDLRLVMGEFSSSRSNKLEGTFSGSFAMNAGNSGDLRTWNGSGQIDLRNGLIWDIPLFGLFSAPLNAVVPGLGHSRASAATANFRMANGQIQSEDLEIRAPALRMQYSGTVDFKGELNARIEAELLRDTWLFGRVLSLALSPLTKLFEYKVTGTLKQPKSEPLYIPKILLMPLNPLKTLREILPVEERPKPPPAESRPNAPSSFLQPPGKVATPQNLG